MYRHRLSAVGIQKSMNRITQLRRAKRWITNEQQAFVLVAMNMCYYLLQKQQRKSQDDMVVLKT
ncbi:cell division protein ZapA [Listeria monocytogenes]|nr:cell division protein ZapA [Listeria monocytogenes]EAF1322807.1 cell division protein ZapA [Listeria monocytogenes]